MQPNQPSMPEHQQPVVSAETGALEHAPVPSAPEAVPQASEPAAPPPSTPVASVQQPAASPAQSATPATPAQGLSAEADEELIDKQWVSQTDSVIARDKDDPHKLEEDEDDLNKDYLKKRFNYDVDNPT